MLQWTDLWEDVVGTPRQPNDEKPPASGAKRRQRWCHQMAWQWGAAMATRLLLWQLISRHCAAVAAMLHHPPAAALTMALCALPVYLLLFALSADAALRGQNRVWLHKLDLSGGTLQPVCLCLHSTAMHLSRANPGH